MRGRSTAAPTLSSSWRDSLSNSLCDLTSELADRAQFQGRLGGDDRVPLSSGPIGLCIHKMRLTTPFPISICDRAGTQAWSSEHLRRARCEAPQTRRPFFPSTSKCFGLRLRSSNNLISGVLGSFDRYCRVGSSSRVPCGPNGLQMFLRCVGSEPGRRNDGQNGALRSIRSRSTLRRSPMNLWPQESEARVELTRPRRTELGFAHQVVDLGEQLRRPIRLTDKTAIIRNLGATGLCLSRSNHEEHIGPPCVDLSREIHTVQCPGHLNVREK
jgi:hypothetical protein